MNYRSHIIAWGQTYQDELAAHGRYLLEHVAERTDKPAVQLLFESSDAVVELIVWESGEAEFSFGAFGDVIDEHVELSGALDCDRLLRRFLTEARAVIERSVP